MYDLVVIGGGPAGLAAALSAHEKGCRRILVIERDRELGGILQQCIHNGFGLHIFNEELTGPEYAQRFINQLHEAGIDYKLDTMVLDISSDKNITAVNTSEGLIQIQPQAIILAMGCRERTRGALAIPGARPSGVMTAGTAQRFVNMEGYQVGKKVLILGSGDIGLIMARRMTLEGAKVLAVAEIMPYSGGLTRNIVQCLDDYQIPLLLEHTVVKVEGASRLEAVTLAKVDSNRKPIPGTEVRYECDTLLLSVGLIPENELSRAAGIQIDSKTQGPIVDEMMQTTIKGIFACGNVVHVHDLVDYVTEESRKAGESAAFFISERENIKNGHEMISTSPGLGVQYIVPQKLNYSGSIKNQELKFFMRVNQIYEQSSLNIKVNGKLVKQFKRSHMAPGEMESVKISFKDILEAFNEGFNESLDEQKLDSVEISVEKMHEKG